MSKAGKRLIAAAKEAAAIARGEKAPARRHVPARIDVRAIRLGLKLSQEEFAAQFGFSLNQIRDWEQERSRPLGGVRAYLTIIASAPERVRQLLTDSNKAA
jgi:putative transcriptional regulator